MSKHIKGKKNHGKYGTKSCVSWRMVGQKIDKEDLIIEGEYQEIMENKTMIIFNGILIKKSLNLYRKVHPKFIQVRPLNVHNSKIFRVIKKIFSQR